MNLDDGVRGWRPYNYAARTSQAPSRQLARRGLLDVIAGGWGRLSLGKVRAQWVNVGRLTSTERISLGLGRPLSLRQAVGQSIGVAISTVVCSWLFILVVLA